MGKRWRLLVCMEERLTELIMILEDVVHLREAVRYFVLRNVDRLSEARHRWERAAASSSPAHRWWREWDLAATTGFRGTEAPPVLLMAAVALEGAVPPAEGSESIASRPRLSSALVVEVDAISKTSPMVVRVVAAPTARSAAQPW